MLTRDLFAVANLLVVLVVLVLKQRNRIMATAESITTDFTTCPICLELFDNPKSLPCLHAFCLKCLQDCFKDQSSGGKVECPVCRKEFQIPAGGLDDLQHHFFVQKLVDLQIGIYADCLLPTCFSLLNSDDNKLCGL